MVIEVKATLRLGDTLVALIVMCDGIHLLNFAGDKKQLFVYMTIGNLSDKIRQMHSALTVVMVTLQPIPIINCNIHQMWWEEQWETNREVLNEVLRRVLPPGTTRLNPSAESGSYNVLCTEGNFRHFNQVLAAWLADYPEYCNVHYLKRHVCVWCECPKNKLRDYVPSDKRHPRQDHNLCRILSDANPKATDAKVSSPHGLRGLNGFCHIPCIVSDFLKPDLLCTMQVNMLDHLQKWIFHFMKTQERLDKNNAI